MNHFDPYRFISNWLEIGKFVSFHSYIQCIIGIHEVPKDSALGRLKGSDNARLTVE
uniref:Uncharacterized protein n=1 Tax=Helianthus annuus TaxID=4232 RepID=A0A251UPW1_HELAN